MEIKRLQSGSRLSRVVVHNGTVYLAGQVADAPRGSTAEQTRQVLAGIDALLASAGTNKSRLLTATVYLTNIADYQEMNFVWEAWIAPDCAPARATVEAQLAAPGYSVEIVAVAAV